jgi:hypothetical protein
MGIIGLSVTLLISELTSQRLRYRLKISFVSDVIVWVDQNTSS